MPRKRSRNPSRGRSSKKQRTVQQLTIAGPWGSKFQIPVARLPITLGSDRGLPAGQSVYPMVNLDVPVIFTRTAVAAGATTSVYALDLTKIDSFSTRFGALFDEYCLVGARLEVRLNNIVVPQGFVCAYIDEKSSSAATLSAAQSSARLDMVVGSESPSRYQISWVPQDFTDLSYSDIGTTTTPAYLKFFCSNAGTGTNAATTFDLMITGTLAFAFRGYK